MCRVLLAAFCGAAAWRSIRIAIADQLASSGTIEGLKRASQFAKDDPVLLARMALYRNGNGDRSPEVEEALRQVARMNPFDAAVLMTLGLQEEFDGNRVAAESYLLRAEEIDHQFKPAWTLANYYYRTAETDKIWPQIQRMLRLEPLGFDTVPVFELCWKLTGDSRKVLTLIPPHGRKPIQYLEFLVNTRRTDAAMGAWPGALAAVDIADAAEVGVLTGFADFLASEGRITDEVTVWNQLVERGVIRSGRLDPAKSLSIADPDFVYAPWPRLFGWHLDDVDGVFSSWSPHALRFDFSGDEPQASPLLWTVAPVISSSPYHLRWRSDSSTLNAPHDPGFSFQIVLQPDGTAVQCPPLLSVGTACDFVTATETRQARIELRYARVLGTKRVSGRLTLFSVSLEVAR